MISEIKSLMDSLNIGIWSWNIASNEFYWDESMHKLYGFQANNFPDAYDAWLNIIHPDDKRRCEAEMTEFLAGKSDWDTRFRIIKPDGEIRHIVGKGSLSRGSDNSPLKISAINLDVSHAARVDAEKMTTAKKMATILEAVAAGLWESDLRAGTLELDDSLYRLYGLNRVDCPDAFEANRRAIHPEDYEKVMGGTMENILAGRSRFDIEFRVVHSDGSLRFLAVKITVERTKDGVPIKMFGVNHDVTELRYVEDQLRQTIAAIDSAAIVAHTDKTGIITYANDRFCEISGYSRSELIGSTHKIINSGHHPKEFFQKMWKMIGSGKTWYGEICNKRKNGTEYWMQTVITPIRNTSGEISIFLSMRIDITAAKNNQLALISTTNRMLEAQRVAKLGNITVDVNSQVEEMSEEVKHIFGFESGEACDREARLARIHPDDRQAYLSAKKEVIQNGAILEGEFRVVHPDETIRYALFRLKAAKGGDDRNIITGTIQDITARKEVELKLLRTQETLTTMLDTVPIGIGMTSPDGEIIGMNFQMLKMLGFETVTDARRAGILSIYQDHQDQQRLLGALIVDSSVKDAEVLFKRSNGSSFWGSLSATKKRQSDGRVVIIFSMIDLTERKRDEALLVQSCKMASLGEMAAGVAHEINTPLAIIVGKASRVNRLLIELKQDSEIITKEVTIINDTAMRIARIVKGLHSFARSGENDPLLETKVSDVMLHTLNLCQERFKAKNVSLLVEEDPDLVLHCRETQIIQVLLNLLNNAFYAVQTLSDKWIRLEVRDAGTNSLQFSVTDSGHGIPVSTAEKIMQPFFTTKPVGTGTGLGLSISRGIAEDHGGKLFLDSSSPNTRFILDLPLKGNYIKKDSVA